MTGLSKKYAAMGMTLSTYCLRHSFATHCHENGMKIYTLKKLLGHEFLTTTRLYVETTRAFAQEVFMRTPHIGQKGKGIRVPLR